MVIKSNTRKGFRLFCYAVSVAAITAMLSAGAHATQGAATRLIEEFHGSLLGVMKKADRLGYRGRYETLTPAVARAFHLPAMTRIVAGRFWKKLNTDQRRALVGAFSRLTTATYAHRFDGYGGERFRIVDEVPVRDKTLLVKTQLVKTDGEIIDIDYLVRHFGSGWRVIDVFLKGSFSELATRRSEYTSLLRRRGSTP